MTSARFDGLRILNPPDYILENWVPENFILGDEPFAKALLIFKTCVLVNNNLLENFFFSIRTTNDIWKNFYFSKSKVISVKLLQYHFFILDFNLLSCDLDNFMIIVLYWVNLYWYYIKVK